MKIGAIIFLIIISFSVNAKVIPESKRVNWSAAGYQGDIPNPSLIVDVTNFGAVGNGTTDNYQSIVGAINSLQGNMGVIYFPAGDYLINSAINLPDSIIIRGKTPDSTILEFDLNGSAINCINVSKAQASSFTGITSGFTKGSLSIIVADTSQFTQGNYAEIRQENGDWDINPASWAEYSVGQIVKIKNISADTLFLENPLRIDYDEALNPEIRKVEPKFNVGIENLKIKRLDCPEEGGGSNIYFDFAAQCWVKGVESDKSVGSHIMLSKSTQVEITECYFHDAFTYDGTATRGYGVTLSHHTGECLVEDNIFKHLRHAMMIKTGANGNVFGYNYSIEPYRSEEIHDFSGDISLHGHYAFTNLFEGNIVQNIIIDHYWGPSGPFNTFFRNRAELYGIIMTTNQNMETDSQNFVGNEVTDMNFLYGQYVLTGANHFEYGNNIKGIIIPSNTDSLPDSSYYLLSKPGFWNIPSEWPSIGIPNIINTGNIPAKLRYDSIYLGFESSKYSFQKLINVYPNPSRNGFFNIQIYSKEKINCLISISNTDAKQIIKTNKLINKGLNNILIDLSDYPDGIYFISFIDKKFRKTIKLLKR